MTHYYPYGGILSQSTNQGVQKYKYNGKEFDTMHGLNMYDYGARQQDPATGMFTSMDSLCEKYYNISPYSYCAGNPIRYVDPTGMAYGDYFDENGKHLGTDGIDDGEIYIVTDRKERKQISKNEGKVEPGSISSAIDIGKVETLIASVGVMNRTIQNGNTAEECSVVSKSGEIVVGEKGTFSGANLPGVEDPAASIHSHTWIPYNGVVGDLAINPSKGVDTEAFMKYPMNVIVGSIDYPNTSLGASQGYGAYNESPNLGMAFFQQNKPDKYIVKLTMSAANKIIEVYKK